MSAAIAQEAPGCPYGRFPRDTRVAGLLGDELRRRGFIEGQNLTIDYRDGRFMLT